MACKRGEQKGRVGGEATGRGNVRSVVEGVGGSEETGKKRTKTQEKKVKVSGEGCRWKEGFIGIFLKTLRGVKVEGCGLGVKRGTLRGGHCSYSQRVWWCDGHKTDST